MSYQKQTWAAGDTIGDAALNHIEDGIFAADTAASAAQDTADNAVTDITLGGSTAPLAKTNGAVKIPAATSETDGFMTAADKAKLDDLEASAVTDITLGSGTTPLQKTDGVVNVPNATSENAGIMTADQADALSRLSKNVVPIANKRYATFHYPSTNYLFGAIGVIRLGATSVSLISANGTSNLYTSDSDLRVYAGESYLQIIFPDNYTHALLLVGGSLTGYTRLEAGTT